MCRFLEVLMYKAKKCKQAFPTFQKSIQLRKRLYLRGKKATFSSFLWAHHLLGWLTGCFCEVRHPFLFWSLMKEITWHKTPGNNINCGFTACVRKGVSIFKRCPKITFLNLTVELFPDYMPLLSKQWINRDPAKYTVIMSKKKKKFHCWCEEACVRLLELPSVIWKCVVERVRGESGGQPRKKKREASWIQIPPRFAGRACKWWMWCMDHSD